jgi:hypothetical protein
MITLREGVNIQASKAAFRPANGIKELRFMASDLKCAHPACNCPAAKGSNYCSEYCHDAGDTLELACGCGHPGCAEELAR